MSVSAVPEIPRRVKVYELQEEKWFDRGTGYCTGEIQKASGDGETVQEDAFILVRSEENEAEILLRSKIVRDDVYQKQQDTLIVWTEPNGVDMALSFQEAEGCAEVWEFLGQVQTHLISIAGGEDILSDDNDMAFSSSLNLPIPDLDNLSQVEETVREASATVAGREALAKFVLNENYLAKLVPLLTIAEEMHSLVTLHRLCNIVKSFILLNDQSIFEYAMRDEVVFGVAGILECMANCSSSLTIDDPDFPNHKANHRQYLSDERRFRQVVPISHAETQRKVHQTFRLQYFKDVVLARFIDDATYGIFHSLILFNQIDIIQYLQQHTEYLAAIFEIFESGDDAKKVEATFFIAQYCSMVKQLQPASRSQPYSILVSHGLFRVFSYAFNHKSPAIRLAVTDVLTLITENDPILIRSAILRKFAEDPNEKQLLSTLVALIHHDEDLGLKGQITEAVRILLDPLAGPVTDAYGKTSEMVLRQRQEDPEADKFLAHFYDHHVHSLLQPLNTLEHRTDLANLSRAETALFNHLCDLVCYFIRMHSFRSKYFVLTANLSSKIARLFQSPEKYLRLAALRYFRTCVGLNDEFYTRSLIKSNLFEPIVDLVMQTGPINNLTNSACLEFFDFIRREKIKSILMHLSSHFKDKLSTITYVDTFREILLREEQAEELAEGEAPPSESVSNGTGGRRWQGVQSVDHDEEDYFNTEEESGEYKPMLPQRPLVNYPDEEDDDMFQAKAKASINKSTSAPELSLIVTGVDDKSGVEAKETAPIAVENIAEKRRRDTEEEEEDLEKVTRKRRSSLRRHSSGHDSHSTSPARKKIAINLAKSPGEGHRGSGR